MTVPHHSEAAPLAVAATSESSGHARHYSRAAFWRKIKTFALRLGRGTVQTSLTLFYCLQDADTPAWAKGVIMGTLGYLILPVDAIPDFVPVVGLTDDLGAIAAALGTVAIYVKDEHKSKAREQMARLFQMGRAEDPVDVEISPSLNAPVEIPVGTGHGRPAADGRSPLAIEQS